MPAESIRRLIAKIDTYNPPELDPGQRVRHYKTQDGQLAYIRMYSAKHLALWSELRRAIPLDSERPLVSVGAGPLLCVLGWVWEQRWPGDVLAVDPMEWQTVLDHKLWRKALKAALPQGVEFQRGYCPPGPLPQQLREADVDAPSLESSDVPPGSVVLLPYALNHLLDERGRPSSKLCQALADWTQALMDKGCDIIIADMPRGKLDCWGPFIKASGAPNTRANFLYNRASQMIAQQIYPAASARRRGGLSDYFTTTKVIHGVGDNWTDVQV